jgi:hypothetical protein
MNATSRQLRERLPKLTEAQASGCERLLRAAIERMEGGDWRPLFIEGWWPAINGRPMNYRRSGGREFFQEALPADETPPWGPIRIGKVEFLVKRRLEELPAGMTAVWAATRRVLLWDEPADRWGSAPQFGPPDAIRDEDGNWVLYPDGIQFSPPELAAALATEDTPESILAAEDAAAEADDE